ncbi:HD domain-containing phosphohydrolase [Geothrix sp. 21YS21S-2]|uniref:HD domain-containing phosphohydrolase n=1 Tax=Geothrix sp. 21YS21S-2 TaxID=3068893 RepID=UPI0027B983AB|nr:HD domain-containing phosphohydrolase [Geothrix sp. 21YS21S-2]
MSPKVLLVDDDPNILAAYTRTLRKRFQFDTAQGGDEALACMRDNDPYGVILSDMRMPGMDGIQFLSRAKELSPDSVRIMLTGNADQNTAIEAVNQGNIFRFLTKPCDPDTLALSLEAGLKQYQLVTAERELVEGTLKGSLALLVDLLSIADPVAFARSQHLAPLAQKIAKVLELESTWVVTVASMLSQIGALTVPPSVMAKVRSGGLITTHERETVTRLPEISSGLIRHIPRMEEVAQAILFMNKNYNGSGFPLIHVREDEIPLGGRILKVASDFLDLEEKRGNAQSALAEMSQTSLFYDPKILQALARTLEMPDEALAEDKDLPHLATHDTVQPGQILVEGVETREGILVYPPLTRVGESHLERLKNFARLVGLKEPFLVLG